MQNLNLRRPVPKANFVHLCCEKSLIILYLLSLLLFLFTSNCGTFICFISGYGQKYGQKCRLPTDHFGQWGISFLSISIVSSFGYTKLPSEAIWTENKNPLKSTDLRGFLVRVVGLKPTSLAVPKTSPKKVIKLCNFMPFYVAYRIQKCLFSKRRFHLFRLSK